MGNDYSDMERKIIIHMIMDSTFLKEVSRMIKLDYLESKYSRIIIKWILVYYEKYKESPKKNIFDLLKSRSKVLSKEDFEIIEEFLYREIKKKKYEYISNYEFFIKQVEEWLKIQSLKYLGEEIEKSIELKDPARGEHAVVNFERVSRFKTENVNILKDPYYVYEALNEERDFLFTFPGDLGKGIGNFYRGDLVSYLGFTNRGKTWWLWYTSYIALSKGYKVIFFTLEMTRNQLIRRVWKSLVGQPETDSIVEIPYFDKSEDDKLYKIRKKSKKMKGISKELKDIKKIQKKLNSRWRGALKLNALPAFGATVNEIFNIIEDLDYYDNYNPDVVVVDYADIIKPDMGFGRSEYRHQLDIIWKRLRGLAQERNILVVTATQSTRSGATQDVGEENIAEDIRKLNHVSKMISINQDKLEHENNISRLKLLKEREGKRISKDITVLQSLDIGRVYIDSRFKKEVDYDDLE